MTDVLKAFIERARAVGIAEAVERLGVRPNRGLRGPEFAAPCPACGGKDRFSWNTAKGVWNCRGADAGGHDGIGLYAHARGFDLRRRDDFLACCGELLGEEIPASGLPLKGGAENSPDAKARESEDERAARNSRMAEQRAASEAAAAKREAEQNRFRAAEIAKARGKWEQAAPAAGTPAEAYLRARGAALPPGGLVRYLAEEPYWHGVDEGGRAAVLHRGPAMIAPFVDAAGAVTGCHITWIDLGRPPKFRPALVDPADGAALPSKKMRGHKRGSVIALAGWGHSTSPLRGGRAEGAGGGLPPQAANNKTTPTPNPSPQGGGEKTPTPAASQPGRVAGLARPSDPHKREGGAAPAFRCVVGEGIETTLAVAAAEGFRPGTFYCAAGDLGNMAGPAADGFSHPVLKATDSRGRARAVRVAGPSPRAGSDAMWVGEAVTQLVLLADGDSERVATAAAMARAKNRHAREGRTITVAWPPAPWGDFAEMAAARGAHNRTSSLTDPFLTAGFSR